MKTRALIALFLVFSFTHNLLIAQGTCQVLLTTLQGTYTGDCKQGLAHGTGEATGEDYYKGQFVRGYPQGKGTYIWKNGATYTGDWEKGLRDGEGVYTYKTGEKDSVLAGMWRDDKYLGKKALAPYVIEYRYGIGRVTCIRVGDRPYVRYKFLRNGGESNIISNLLLQGSSGSESNTAAFTGFDEVKFPFTGKVEFNAPNAWYTASLTCELRLKINQPGAWLVNISF